MSAGTRGPRRRARRPARSGGDGGSESPIAPFVALLIIMRSCIMLLSLAAAVGATNHKAMLNSGKIEHVVVLYMENRVRTDACAVLCRADTDFAARGVRGYRRSTTILRAWICRGQTTVHRARC